MGCSNNTPLALLPLGEGLSSAGTAMSLAKDLKNGNGTGVMITVGTTALSGGLGKVITNAKDITPVGKTILGAVNTAYGKAMDVVAEKAQTKTIKSTTKTTTNTSTATSSSQATMQLVPPVQKAPPVLLPAL